MKKKIQILSSMIAMILCFTLTTSQVHATAIPIGITPTVPVVVAGTSAIPVNLDTILSSIDRGIGLIATGQYDQAKANYNNAMLEYHKKFLSSMDKATANQIGVYSMKKEASVAVGETVAQYVPVVATYVKDGVTSISQKLVDAYTKWMIGQGAYDIETGSVTYANTVKTPVTVNSINNAYDAIAYGLKEVGTRADRAETLLNTAKKYISSSDVCYIEVGHDIDGTYDCLDINVDRGSVKVGNTYSGNIYNMDYLSLSINKNEKLNILGMAYSHTNQKIFAGAEKGRYSTREERHFWNINGDAVEGSKYSKTNNIATLQGDDVVLPTGWTGEQTISDVIGNIVDGVIQGTDIPAVFPVDSTIPITLDLPIDSVIDGLAWPDLPDITWPTDAPDVITNTYEGDKYTTYEGSQTSVFEGNTIINEGDITNIYEGDLTKVYPVASDKLQTGEGTKDTTFPADVPVDDSFIEKMVNWALDKLNGTTGLLSKFPFSVPYDMYLIVNALSGNTGGNLLSDVKTVSVSGLNAPSEKYAVGTKNMDFTIPFVVADKTYDIDIPISKVSWLFQYIKYGNGILFTIGALRWVVKKE